LAWGNSLPDFVSNVISAKQGQAKMGISACYGGSVFNILLGIGIPFTIACIESGTLIVIFYLNVTISHEFLIFS
jgi:solute carrier family 24 (sodium/potassium/calcium exchanger), member 6